MTMRNLYYYDMNVDMNIIEEAWHKFVNNNEIDRKILKKEIIESWKTSKNQGIDPFQLEIQKIIDDNNLEELKEKNRLLLSTAYPFVEMLYNSVKWAGFRIDLADCSGNLLLNMGSSEAGQNSDYKFLEGINLSEEVIGTNAVGLAIKHEKPFLVLGAEHYNKTFHDLVCSAAPIFDNSNRLIGVLNMAGKRNMSQNQPLGMVLAVSRAIENEIRIQTINQDLIENNYQLATILSVVSDGVVYVKDDRIVQINKRMSELLGKNEEEVINKKVDEAIIAFPSVEESIKRTETDNHVEIMITGNDNNYNCLLQVCPINKNENSFVMSFTKTDEINMLARMLKKYDAFFNFEDIIGRSFGMKEAITLAKKASNYNYKVIIEGESGTGKEMFAQAIHNSSMRKNKPFITVDCGAIPQELLEKELFGCAENSFLGTKEGKPGKFELANGGTIFLNEVINIPIEMQAKMLRLLQEERITRVGGNMPIPLDVRIIAATSSNLKEEVKNGNFREDLFYRLSVVYIKIPPLRQRKEDIPILVDYFIKKNITNKAMRIDKKAMDMLERYFWPGNVRELHNAVQRAIMMSEGQLIKKEDFSLNILDLSGKDTVEKAELNTLDEQMSKYIMQVLAASGGNISEAARILNVSRATIYSALNRKGTLHKSKKGETNE